MTSRCFAILGLLLIASACSQSPVLAPTARAGAVLRRPVLAGTASPRASWIRRDLTNPPLLYVTNANTVTIYSGLGGSALTLVGEIFGFQNPVGECVDGQGDVFIADGPAHAVDEYAYGSVVPKGVISDTLGEPYACAVDAATGRLAVTNLSDASGNEPGNLLVYASPTSAPAEYTDPQMNEPLFCTFDRKGNLDIDAYDSSFHPVMTQLRKTATKLKTLTLSGLDPKKLYEPSGLEPAGPVMLWGNT